MPRGCTSASSCDVAAPPLTHADLFANPHARVNLIVGGKAAGKWTLLTQWLAQLRRDGRMDRLLIVSPYKARDPYQPFTWTPNFANPAWLATLEAALGAKPAKEQWVVVLHQCFWNPAVHTHRLFRRLFVDAEAMGVTLFEVRLQMPTDVERESVDGLVVFPRASQTPCTWNEQALRWIVFDPRRVGQDIGPYETAVADFTAEGKTRQALLPKVAVKPVRGLWRVSPAPFLKDLLQEATALSATASATPTPGSPSTDTELVETQPATGWWSWLTSFFV